MRIGQPNEVLLNRVVLRATQVVISRDYWGPALPIISVQARETLRCQSLQQFERSVAGNVGPIEEVLVGGLSNPSVGLRHVATYVLICGLKNTGARFLVGFLPAW